MSQNSDSQPKPFQNQNDKSSCSKETASHLTLVVSNPEPVQEKTPESTLPNAGFKAEVRNIAPQAYEIEIQDSAHELECDLLLNIKKQRGRTAVVCHFPDIFDDSNKLLEEDETLYGTIMIQFQLKVLEQLFLFCGDHKASQLIISMEDATAEGFEIYHHFLSQQGQSLATDGGQTEMVISTNTKALNGLRNFMKENTLQLEQSLWRQQNSNPAIRNYLKSQARKGTLIKEQ